MRFLEQVCVMGSGTQMTAKACWALVQVNKGYARNCHGHFMYDNLFDLSVVIVYIIRLRLRVIQHKTQSFVCLFKYLVWFPCVTLWKIPGYDKPYQAFYITYVHVFWWWKSGLWLISWEDINSQFLPTEKLYFASILWSQ